MIRLEQQQLQVSMIIDINFVNLIYNLMHKQDIN